MSEFSLVEKPFFDQLAALGWAMIDQGAGIPTDPSKSLRASFRDVTLRQEFQQIVRAINTTGDGRPWLTDKQLDDLHDELIGQTTRSLVETNEAVLKLLFRSQVDANELTGEQYPNVKLIDFEHPERNRFLAISQFRIDTPGAGKGFIIPDIVLFVNGLPLVVIECKIANDFTVQPDVRGVPAVDALQRPAGGDEAGRACGRASRGCSSRINSSSAPAAIRAEFGTITATDEEFFFPWKDIHPEKYRTFTPPLGVSVRSAGNA